MDKTLSIIKPDATSRNISGQINSIIEKSGLKIIAQKMIKLNIDQANRQFLITRNKLTNSGYKHYEISNFAKA